MPTATPESEPTRDASPRSRPGPLKRVLFALVPIVVILGGIEATARLLLPPPDDAALLVPAPDGGWSPSVLHRPDPFVLWRNASDADLEYKGVRVRTNAFGLRGEPVSREKPPGVFRVLSLGESTTFGSRIEQDATYSARLEACLDERFADRGAEVLNAGTPGWSLVQSRVWLERDGLAFDPDVVLLYHGYNDFLPPSYVERRTAAASAGEERAGPAGARAEAEAEAEAEAASGEGPNAPSGAGSDASDAPTDRELVDRAISRGTGARIADWLRGHSRAFRWLGDRAREAAGDAGKTASERSGAGERRRSGTPGGAAPTVEEAMGATVGGADADAPTRVPEEDRRAELERLLGLSRRHGFELIVLVPCYREFDAHRELLLEFAEANDVATLDLEEALASLGGRREDHFLDASHPGPALHAAYAAWICDALSDRLRAARGE